MNLLMAVDLSESTRRIVATGTGIAQALSAKVWLLHVAEPEPDFVGLDVGPQTVRDTLAERFHREHLQLQEIAERMRQAGVETTALLVQGPTVETILQEAAKLHVKMVVIGSHGRSAVYKLLVGSVSEGVLHQAECPILVIPTHERPEKARLSPRKPGFSLVEPSSTPEPEYPVPGPGEFGSGEFGCAMARKCAATEGQIAPAKARA